MTIPLQEALFLVFRKSPDMALNVDVSCGAKLYDVGLLPMAPTQPSPLSVILESPKFAVPGRHGISILYYIVHKCQICTNNGVARNGDGHMIKLIIQFRNNHMMR